VTLNGTISDVNGNSLGADYSWKFTTAASNSIPDLTAWEQNMVTYGNKWCAYLNSSATYDAKLLSTYYDAQWVFFQIGDYTGDPKWNDCAESAERIYRDQYVRANNYVTSGYWRFPHGIYEDYVRNTPAGTKSTLTDIRGMRDLPAFSDPDTNTYAGDWYHAHYAREMSYAVDAQLEAEKAGEPRQVNRMHLYMAMLANHLNQWQNNDYTHPSTNDPNANYMQPFMAGLVMQALIDFYEWEVKNNRNPDDYFPDIPGRLQNFTSWLFNKAVIVSGPGAGKRMWIADLGGSSGNWTDAGGTGYGAFRYTDRYTPNEYSSSTVPEPAPDLNLLIATAYAWVYKMTGSLEARSEADTIFSSGVKTAAVDWNGKIFDQNYRWSFDYIKYRRQGDQNWGN